MKVFKTAITANNNEDLRDEFFREPIVIKIWEKLGSQITMKDFFKVKVGNPNKKIFKTYSSVTKIMEGRYHLEMSQEWKDKFPKEE